MQNKECMSISLNGSRKPVMLPLLTGLAVLVAVIIFVLFAGAYITLPGIYYDEVTFLNAALGGVNDSFIFMQLFKAPVMIMPYIGALKSYLYYPVFKLWGVSATTIRLPAIIISACSIFLWFKICREIFSNRLLPLLFTFILATDPAFIFQSKLDWGPVAIQIFLISMSLCLFLKILKNHSVKLFWLLLGVLLLGVYNKLNFIWFLIAFGVAGVIFYYQDIRQIYQDKHVGFFYGFVVFILILALVFLLLIIPASGLGVLLPSVGFYEKLSSIINLYCSTMNGAGVYRFVFNKILVFPSWINYFSIITFLSWLCCRAFFKNRASVVVQGLNKHILFFSTIFLVIFIQIVITRQSGGSHHIMMLWPLHYLLLFLMLNVIVLTFGFSQKVANSLLFVAIVTLVGSQIMAVMGYELAFKQADSFNSKWSPKIYLLANYLRQYGATADFIVTPDWGLGNQLFALADDNITRLKYIDLYQDFIDQDLHKTNEKKFQAELAVLNRFGGVIHIGGPLHLTNMDLYKIYFQNKKDLVILYAMPYQNMPNVRENFFKFSKQYLHTVKLIHIINDEQNRPLYEIYATQ